MNTYIVEFEGFIPLELEVLALDENEAKSKACEELGNIYTLNMIVSVVNK